MGDNLSSQNRSCNRPTIAYSLSYNPQKNDLFKQPIQECAKEIPESVGNIIDSITITDPKKLDELRRFHRTCMHELMKTRKANFL
jgi:tRNA uridine 5-carbamoylmethylation protein Kti12